MIKQRFDIGTMQRRKKEVRQQCVEKQNEVSQAKEELDMLKAKLESLRKERGLVLDEMFCLQKKNATVLSPNNPDGTQQHQSAYLAKERSITIQPHGDGLLGQDVGLSTEYPLPKTIGEAYHGTPSSGVVIKKEPLWDYDPTQFDSGVAKAASATQDETVWYAYKCGSGETLFYYNILTGEHIVTCNGCTCIPSNGTGNNHGLELETRFSANESTVEKASVATETELQFVLVNPDKWKSVRTVATETEINLVVKRKTYKSIGTMTEEPQDGLLKQAKHAKVKMSCHYEVEYRHISPKGGADDSNATRDCQLQSESDAEEVQIFENLAQVAKSAIEKSKRKAFDDPSETTLRDTYADLLTSEHPVSHATVPVVNQSNSTEDAMAEKSSDQPIMSVTSDNGVQHELIVLDDCLVDTNETQSKPLQGNETARDSTKDSTSPRNYEEDNDRYDAPSVDGSSDDTNQAFARDSIRDSLQPEVLENMRVELEQTEVVVPFPADGISEESLAFETERSNASSLSAVSEEMCNEIAENCKENPNTETPLEFNVSATESSSKYALQPEVEENIIVEVAVHLPADGVSEKSLSFENKHSNTSSIRATSNQICKLDEPVIKDKPTVATKYMNTSTTEIVLESMSSANFGDSREPYICKYCGTRLTNEFSGLQTHLTSHGVELKTDDTSHAQGTAVPKWIEIFKHVVFEYSHDLKNLKAVPLPTSDVPSDVPKGTATDDSKQEASASLELNCKDIQTGTGPETSSIAKENVAAVLSGNDKEDRSQNNNTLGSSSGDNLQTNEKGGIRDEELTSTLNARESDDNQERSSLGEKEEESSASNGDVKCRICGKEFKNNRALCAHRHWHFRKKARKSVKWTLLDDQPKESSSPSTSGVGLSSSQVPVIENQQERVATRTLTISQSSFASEESDGSDFVEGNVSTYSPRKDKEIRCTQCKRTFKTPKAASIHQKWHLRVRRKSLRASLGKTLGKRLLRNARTKEVAPAKTSKQQKRARVDKRSPLDIKESEQETEYENEERREDATTKCLLPSENTSVNTSSALEKEPPEDSDKAPAETAQERDKANRNDNDVCYPEDEAINMKEGDAITNCLDVEGNSPEDKTCDEEKDKEHSENRENDRNESAKASLRTSKRPANQDEINVASPNATITQSSSLPTSFNCRLCTKIFRNQEKLDKHEDLHKAMKKHFCHICKKTMSSRYQYFVEHMNVHNGVRSYCSECGKSFKYSSNMYKHKKKSHSGLIGTVKEGASSTLVNTETESERAKEPVETPTRMANEKDMRNDKGDCYPEEEAINVVARGDDIINCLDEDGHSLENKTYDEQKENDHTDSSRENDTNKPVASKNSLRASKEADNRDKINVASPNTNITPSCSLPAIFKCRLCTKNFKDQKKLDKHVDLHRAMKVHICHICKKMMSRYQYFVEHMNAHNGVRFACSECGTSFKYSSNMYAHKKKFHSVVETESEDESSEPPSKESAKLKHLRDHVATRSTTIADVDSLEMSKTAVIKNVNTSSSMPKLFRCRLCLQKFKTKAKLFKHKKEHKAMKIHTCHVCEKTLTSYSYFVEHMNAHDGVKYACSECGELFKYTSNMSSHKRKWHKKGSFCKTCGKEFTTKALLKEHQCNAPSRKYIYCEECGMPFLFEARLEKHMTRHRFHGKEKDGNTPESTDTGGDSEPEASSGKRKRSSSRYEDEVSGNEEDEEMKDVPDVPEDVLHVETADSKFYPAAKRPKSQGSEYEVTDDESSSSDQEAYAPSPRRVSYKCSVCNKTYKYEASYEKHVKYQHVEVTHLRRSHRQIKLELKTSELVNDKQAASTETSNYDFKATTTAESIRCDLEEVRAGALEEQGKVGYEETNKSSKDKSKAVEMDIRGGKIKENEGMSSEDADKLNKEEVTGKVGYKETNESSKDECNAVEMEIRAGMTEQYQSESPVFKKMIDYQKAFVIDKPRTTVASTHEREIQCELCDFMCVSDVKLQEHLKTHELLCTEPSSNVKASKLGKSDGLLDIVKDKGKDKDIYGEITKAETEFILCNSTVVSYEGIASVKSILFPKPGNVGSVPDKVSEYSASYHAASSAKLENIVTNTENNDSIVEAETLKSNLCSESTASTPSFPDKNNDKLNHQSADKIGENVQNKYPDPDTMPPKNKLNKCEECGLTFARPCSLGNHLRVHKPSPVKIKYPDRSPSDKHKCHVCGVTFTCASILYDHLPIHKSVLSTSTPMTLRKSPRKRNVGNKAVFSSSKPEDQISSHPTNEDNLSSKAACLTESSNDDVEPSMEAPAEATPDLPQEAQRSDQEKMKLTVPFKVSCDFCGMPYTSPSWLKRHIRAYHPNTVPSVSWQGNHKEDLSTDIERDLGPEASSGKRKRSSSGSEDEMSGNEEGEEMKDVPEVLQDVLHVETADSKSYPAAKRPTPQESESEVRDDESGSTEEEADVPSPRRVPYKCSVCNKTYKYEASYEKHVKYQHVEVEKVQDNEKLNFASDLDPAVFHLTRSHRHINSERKTSELVNDKQAASTETSNNDFKAATIAESIRCDLEEVKAGALEKQHTGKVGCEETNTSCKDEINAVEMDIRAGMTEENEGMSSDDAYKLNKKEDTGKVGYKETNKSSKDESNAVEMNIRVGMAEEYQSKSPVIKKMIDYLKVLVTDKPKTTVDEKDVTSAHEREIQCEVCEFVCVSDVKLQKHLKTHELLCTEQSSDVKASNLGESDGLLNIVKNKFEEIRGEIHVVKAQTEVILENSSVVSYDGPASAKKNLFKTLGNVDSVPRKKPITSNSFDDKTSSLLPNDKPRCCDESGDTPNQEEARLVSEKESPPITATSGPLPCPIDNQLHKHLPVPAVSQSPPRIPLKTGSDDNPDDFVCDKEKNKTEMSIAFNESAMECVGGCSPKALVEMTEMSASDAIESSMECDSGSSTKSAVEKTEMSASDAIESASECVGGSNPKALVEMTEMSASDATESSLECDSGSSAKSAVEKTEFSASDEKLEMSASDAIESSMEGDSGSSAKSAVKNTEMSASDDNSEMPPTDAIESAMECNDDSRQNSDEKPEMTSDANDSAMECDADSTSFQGTENIKQYSCDICGATYVFPGTLENHKRKHKTNFPSPLGVRSCRLRKKQDAKKALFTDASDESTECVDETSFKGTLDASCTKLTDSTQTETSSEVEESSKEVSPKQDVVKQFVCHICGTHYIRPGCLRNHLEKHQAELTSPPVSGAYRKKKAQEYKGAPATEAASPGGESQAEDKPFKCHVCSAAYMYEASLQNHLLIHESNNKKETISKRKSPSSDGDHYQCQICSKVYINRIRFLKHTDGHASPFKRNRSSIYDASAAASVQYPCDACGEVFTHPDHLEEHTREAHKSFVCRQCDSSFPCASDLTTHLRTHTRVSKQLKLYCQVCGKSFNTAAKLVVHFRRHTNEKAVQIKVPDELEPVQIQQQKRKKHKYVCNECDLTFPTILKKALHCRYVHKRTSRQPQEDSKTNQPDRSSTGNYLEQRIETPNEAATSSDYQSKDVHHSELANEVSLEQAGLDCGDTEHRTEHINEVTTTEGPSAEGVEKGSEHTEHLTESTHEVGLEEAGLDAGDSELLTEHTNAGVTPDKPSAETVDRVNHSEPTYEARSDVVTTEDPSTEGVDVVYRSEPTYEASSDARDEGRRTKTASEEPNESSLYTQHGEVISECVTMSGSNETRIETDNTGSASLPLDLKRIIDDGYKANCRIEEAQIEDDISSPEPPQIESSNNVDEMNSNEILDDMNIGVPGAQTFDVTISHENSPDPDGGESTNSTRTTNDLCTERHFIATEESVVAGDRTCAKDILMTVVNPTEDNKDGDEASERECSAESNIAANLGSTNTIYSLASLDQSSCEDITDVKESSCEIACDEESTMDMLYCSEWAPLILEESTESEQSVMEASHGAAAICLDQSTLDEDTLLSANDLTSDPLRLGDSGYLY